jgi:hypothetical protein
MDKETLEKYLDDSERYYEELKEEMKKDWSRKEKEDERNNLSSGADIS